jgi:Tetratricopeptide repeat
MTDLILVLVVILLLAAFALGERLYRGLIRREPEQDRIGDLMTRAHRLRAEGDADGAKAAEHDAYQIHFQNYQREALERFQRSSREREALYRRQAHENWMRFAPRLAVLLSHAHLWEPDGARALAAHREAADIYRKLAKEKPTRFAHRLARCLNSLAIYQVSAGDGAAAVVAVREAVEVRRALAKRDLMRFGPGLANNLSHLSIRLQAIGDGEGALAARREAIDIYRALARDQPDRFASVLAKNLRSLVSLSDQEPSDKPGHVTRPE